MSNSHMLWYTMKNYSTMWNSLISSYNGSHKDLCPLLYLFLFFFNLYDLIWEHESDLQPLTRCKLHLCVPRIKIHLFQGYMTKRSSNFANCGSLIGQDNSGHLNIRAILFFFSCQSTYFCSHGERFFFFLLWKRQFFSVTVESLWGYTCEFGPFWVYRPKWKWKIIVISPGEN